MTSTKICDLSSRDRDGLHNDFSGDNDDDGDSDDDDFYGHDSDVDGDDDHNLTIRWQKLRLRLKRLRKISLYKYNHLDQTVLYKPIKTKVYNRQHIHL